jgi:hypothetical protein
VEILHIAVSIDHIAAEILHSTNPRPAVWPHRCVFFVSRVTTFPTFQT